MNANDSDDHFQPRGDPPTVADIEQIEPVTNLNLGNLLYICCMEKLPSGDFIAYLGLSLPYSTPETGVRDTDIETSFTEYVPVGAVHAIERNGGEYFELDLPDEDALDRACKTRRRREDEHRSVLVSELSKGIKKRRKMHFEEYKQHEPEGGFESLDELDLSQQEMYQYAFNRGMCQMAQLFGRWISQHSKRGYNGTRRWSHHDVGGVV